ncbi:hypothetical protein [Streptomyces sp. NRRL F-2799]|uniref:hypothetical protein n=1 Tax=Streptomyces sp. NRRL F-2799 TaxID=1463844 RepID=UPI0004C6F98D|nr:hypothetical protein [Streptomyces sp. NRRL F-2799]
MRIRATVAAVTGALALSAFAVPAAHAAPAAPYTMNVSFSNLKIASSIKVGTTNMVSATYSYTLTHGSDVKATAADFYSDAYLFRGTLDDPTATVEGDDVATCKVATTTTLACTGTIDIYPADGDLTASDAGKWSVAAEAIAYNGQNPSSPDYSKVGFKDAGGLATTSLLRYSKLTTDASPEPVLKGRTITVTGTLTRASWDYNKYYGYGAQSVKLQFAPKGSTYTTLKTVTTDSYGKLKTTVTASVDGSYRYVYAGVSTTAAVTSAADAVDVQ